MTDPHTAAVRLLELSKLATAGPWHAKDHHRCDFIPIIHELTEPGAITKNLVHVISRRSWLAEARANADLIAAARNDLPAICEALLRVEGALREVLGDVERIRSACRFESDPDDFTRTEKYAHACATTAKNRIDAALSPRTPQADGETP